MLHIHVPTGSPSRGGDVAVYVNLNQPSLSTLFYSDLVSISVFMALSIVFHSINSPDNSPLSHSVLPVLLFCLLGPFNYTSLCESLLRPRYNLLWLTGLKASTGGDFFLACEEFWRMFDNSLPACAFLLFFLKWRLTRAHYFHSLGQDQSTVAQQAETTVTECSPPSCV